MRFFQIVLLCHGAVFLISSLQAWALTNSVPADSIDLSYDVRINTDGVDDQGESVPAYCNASLLSDRSLVTAAHCFQDANRLGSHALAITLGHYIWVTRPDGQRVRVGYMPQPEQDLTARFIFLPALQSRLDSDPSTSIGPDEDIALAVFDQPVKLPAGFQFAAPLSPSEFETIQDEIGNFHPTVVTVNPDAWMSTSDTKRMAELDSVSWSSPGFFESKSTAQVEPGDSGAPLLATVNGKQRLVGVVKGHGSTLFGSWDAFAPAGAALCQLTQTAGLVQPGCAN